MATRTLIIVDDDHFLAEGIERNIEHYTGYECRIFTTGQSALRYARTHLVDIALIDLGLPDISGSEVVAALKEWHPHTGQIILSKRSDLGTKLRSFDQGVDDYLPKPFTMMELLARIKAVERRLFPALATFGERCRIRKGLWLYPGRIVYNGTRIPLSVPHCLILQALWKAHPGIVPQSQLATLLTPNASKGAITTTIYRIKNALARNNIPLRVVNVYNQGYSVENLNTKFQIRNE